MYTGCFRKDARWIREKFGILEMGTFLQLTYSLTVSFPTYVDLTFQTSGGGSESLCRLVGQIVQECAKAWAICHNPTEILAIKVIIILP